MQTGDVRRPPKRLIESFRAISTSTISNALDKKGLGGVMLGLKPIALGMRVLGCAVTIFETSGERGSAAPEEMNLAAIIEAIQPGDVAVIANDGNRISSGGGVFGFALKNRGAAGAVVDGGVRDIEQIQEHALPVFAKHIVPLTGKGRIKVHSINHPITADGVFVRPGDIIVGDANGVVCIPQDFAEDLLALAEKQDSSDNQTIELMRQGLSFREAQARSGVK